jgi:hypothetical protein
MPRTHDQIFNGNAKKLQKHFENYCRTMGMNPNDWDSRIYVRPPKMMEGTSPKRLNAEFTNKTTGKRLTFYLGVYDRKYEISGPS